MLAAVLRTDNSEDKRQVDLASAKPAGRTHQFRRPVQRYLDEETCKLFNRARGLSARCTRSDKAATRATVAGDGGYGHAADVQQANSMIISRKHLDMGGRSVRCTFAINRYGMA
jgi:hypothetical protein